MWRPYVGQFLNRIGDFAQFVSQGVVFPCKPFYRVGVFDGYRLQLVDKIFQIGEFGLDVGKMLFVVCHTVSIAFSVQFSYIPTLFLDRSRSGEYLEKDRSNCQES